MSDTPNDALPPTAAQMTSSGSSRRGFLTEAAAAVTALGVGEILFGGQQVSAATATPGELAAVGQSNVVMLTPSGDTSGKTDIAAINTALTAAQPGDQVWLSAGDWYINQPINMPPMRVLRGTRGAVAGGDSPGYGTNINVVQGFTTPYPNLCAAILILDMESGGWPQLGSTAGPSPGVQIRDLTIDGSQGPAGVDGILGYGRVIGVSLTDVCVYGATGYGIHCEDNPNAIGPHPNPDGWKALRVMIQQPANTGWYQVPDDTTAVDVHIQGAGTPTLTAHGFHVTGGNVRFIGCRADLSTGCGWVIDHSGAGGGYTDATVLAGCGTQRNQWHGVLVTNSSSTGTDWRAPVVISGCSFGEDGCGAIVSGAHTGGDYAGIWVEGNNRVLISGTTVWVGTVDFTAGCPKYGLTAAPIGSTLGVPALVAMTGGHLNYSTVSGGMPVNNSAPAQKLLISSDITSSAGFQTGQIDARVGTATLSGGTATVTNPWVTTSCRIFLSNVTASGGPGIVYVSEKNVGSFTIQSTSATDTSKIAWQIVSQ